MINMSEVSGFHHGIGVEEGVESIWVILCPYEGWCFEGSLIWVMEKKSENLGLEI